MKKLKSIMQRIKETTSERVRGKNMKHNLLFLCWGSTWAWSSHRTRIVSEEGKKERWKRLTLGFSLHLEITEDCRESLCAPRDLFLYVSGVVKNKTKKSGKILTTVSGNLVENRKQSWVWTSRRVTSVVLLSAGKKYTNVPDQKGI